MNAAISPATIDAQRGVFDEVSAFIHAHPETRFEEFAARDTLTTRLAKASFRVQTGIGGLETSFIATHGTGDAEPHIGILVEYDALPGIGHGCGHNLIAAGGLSAAMMAVDTLPNHPGWLSVVGTPGEEGGGGKIVMAEHGAFDGLDAVMMFHPADRSLIARHGLAAHHIEIAFTGVAAHAAKNPEEGRSAAAAAHVFMSAIDAMRQFMPPTARVHGIIRTAGDAPNVVPDRAVLEYFVRDRTASAAADLRHRVELAARGAAMATETTCVISNTAPIYADRINNMTMARRFGGYLTESGMELTPVSKDNPAGSSDIGNVSHLIPTIHPYVQIADLGTASHSIRFRQAAATARAAAAAMNAAVALGSLALDLLTDAEFLATAALELAEARQTPQMY